RFGPGLDAPRHGGGRVRARGSARHAGLRARRQPPGFRLHGPRVRPHFAGALATLHIRRAHLVLHDFGGPWGLAWAATHPNESATATLIKTGVLRGYRWHYLARIWRTPLLGAFVSSRCYALELPAASQAWKPEGTAEGVRRPDV